MSSVVSNLFRSQINIERHMRDIKNCGYAIDIKFKLM